MTTDLGPEPIKTTVGLHMVTATKARDIVGAVVSRIAIEVMVIERAILASIPFAFAQRI